MEADCEPYLAEPAASRLEVEREARDEARAPLWFDARLIRLSGGYHLALLRYDTEMEINGIAHVILTVRSMAASRAFYVALLEQMGLTQIIDSSEYLYYVGGRTGVGLRPAAPEHAADRFDQGRTGLHHVCFRASEREDVDSIHAVALKLGALIVHPPREDGWVPGYYSVLFEDPDGIRLEVAHIPGKDVFEPATGH